jgi:hypothetical protein
MQRWTKRSKAQGRRGLVGRRSSGYSLTRQYGSRCIHRLEDVIFIFIIPQHEAKASNGGGSSKHYPQAGIDNSTTFLQFLDNKQVCGAIVSKRDMPCASMTESTFFVWLFPCYVMVDA